MCIRDSWLSVEILGHATWINASIPLRLFNRSFVISVNSNSWTFLPSFSNSFLNFNPYTFDNCPSFNPIIIPKDFASAALKIASVAFFFRERAKSVTSLTSLKYGSNTKVGKFVDNAIPAAWKLLWPKNT